MEAKFDGQLASTYMTKNAEEFVESCFDSMKTRLGGSHAFVVPDDDASLSEKLLFLLHYVSHEWNSGIITRAIDNTLPDFEASQKAKYPLPSIILTGKNDIKCI